MDIQFYGANCIAVTTKQARIVVDDNLSELGAKPVAKPGDIVLYTGDNPHTAVEPKIAIAMPGEYEVTGIAIYGIAARAHMDEEKQRSTTMYKLIIDDAKILITGHAYPELTDNQLESIGMVDIMLVPVGGNGYTLDSVGALKLIKKIEPKVVIPTHYDDAKLTFPVPQQTLEQAIKGLAMEPKETVTKLKVKAGELAQDVTQLVILEKS
ncbi:MAG TPA: MBL fold metallo-hydrolase [Ktedonobacteraceae bacterium]|nr:MBL fold metallo-hydrolase [Ktedonobacteraceae bacterium]